ncbi:diguanylate cyclase [Alteromonas lipolytica]|uniref:Diguanylate cyclase n=1 Tax=Alteromonas lipolytica TaxID=1856405 RepID=A0A1E8FKA3_9ALTE|nr:diguanylate cyclase [Alteromonas lipolytica]OFI36367.1 hypothetical protein BFC17_00360 [Alteromonas lipolytica]GGF70485.1 hypothetical protein GCM10011338_23300 [Alteromonas lipolytica]
MVDETQTAVFESTFEHCGVGLAHVSPKGEFIRVNKSLSAFLGYTREELVQLDFQKITHPDYLNEDLQYLAEMLDGMRNSYHMEKLYIHKKGHVVWGKLTVTLVCHADGSPAFFISVVEDIDDKKRYEQNYFESQETLRSIISSLSDRMAVWVAKPDLSSLIYLNEGYQRIWGRDAAELFNAPRSFITHIHAADRQRVQIFYQRTIQSPWQFEYRVMRDDGELRYIRERGEVIRDHGGEVIFLVITADDITHDRQLTEALKSANDRLNVLSRIDDLTGINNRRECLHAVDTEFKRLRRIGERTTSTLAFLDLDKFKQINDNYGHQTGDKALIALTERIQATMRVNDILGRYGGDEFLLLLPDTRDYEAESLLNRIFSQPVTVTSDDGVNVTIQCSIGLAQWDKELDTVQHWIELADQQMYQIKGSKS